VIVIVAVEMTTSKNQRLYTMCFINGISLGSMSDIISKFIVESVCMLLYYLELIICKKEKK